MSGASTCSRAPPADGWLMLFFSAGGKEGAFCITCRAPDAAQDDHALKRGYAAFVQRNPDAAACDAVFAHLVARVTCGLRLAVAPDDGLAPDQDALQALFAGADSLRLTVAVGPDFGTSVARGEPAYDLVQLALIRLAGGHLANFSGARRLVIEIA